MKRKDYLYIFLLMMIPLLFLFIITSQNLLFGNKVDWFNQHITIADALRHAIREEGTIFPTYLSHLMSGVNIYYFSYYGSLRFDVLLGALFINVKMIDQGSSEFNIIIGVKNSDFETAIKAIYDIFVTAAL